MYYTPITQLLHMYYALPVRLTRGEGKTYSYTVEEGSVKSVSVELFISSSTKPNAGPRENSLDYRSRLSLQRAVAGRGGYLLERTLLEFQVEPTG